jgi:hypothetical protein
MLIVPFAVKSQDDDSKAIKAEVFIKARPARTTRTNARYKPVTKSADSSTPPEGMAFAQMGLTMWRFRPTKANDKTKELVEEDDGQQVEWTLERMAEGTTLSPGQRVRLSFESLSRTGFLYVVDREEYADGTFGDPILIFPTQKSIDNYKVEPGRLTYIPSATGRFRIKPSDSAKVHVAESLTIIVSPTQLIDDGQLQPKAIKLQPEQFNQWLKLWKATTTKFEMDGGPGQAMSQAEQLAAKLNSPLLSQGDPVPQTVYQLVVKPENPLLIVLPLRFAR